ncbi:hypothetical protein Bbelb_018760 [Branchiostoma belcheri]|nr:hypothetical protein Bbelb_018760 [Branchiostoma belcheri]
MPTDADRPVAYPRETRQDELRKDSKDWRLISAPETVIVYMPYVEGRTGRDLQFVSDEPVLRDSPKHTGNLGADTPRVHLGNQWKLAETSDFLASIHRYPRGKSRRDGLLSTISGHQQTVRPPGRGVMAARLFMATIICGLLFTTDRKTSELSIPQRLSVLGDRLKSGERNHVTVCARLSASEKRQLVEDIARLDKV